MANPITDKDEIIKLAKKYLKENSLIDLWWFIRDDMNYVQPPDSFVRDVAHKMVGSGRYEFAYTDHQRIFLIVKKHWIAAYPVRFITLTSVISALISLSISLITRQDNSQLQFLKDTQQDSLIHILTDSTASLRHQLNSPIKMIEKRPNDSSVGGK